MRAVIIQFPGTNREIDMIRAIKAAGATVTPVWHQARELPKTDLIILPGGFAHGDYLRCGAMAALSPAMTAVIEKARAGTPILGVCNGFQVLTEAGLLPGALMRNAGLRFICRQVDLEVVASSRFTGAYRPGQQIRVPVAHHDGNYFCDDDTLKRLEDEDRIAFRYVTDINGSRARIAGVLNESRSILGMMPHPEDRIEAGHGGSDGFALFKGLVESLA